MNLNFYFFKRKKMLSVSSSIKSSFYPSDMGCFLFHILYVSVVFIYRMSCILGSIFIFLFFSTGLSLHVSLPYKYNHRSFIVFFLIGGRASVSLSFSFSSYYCMFVFQQNLYDQFAYFQKLWFCGFPNYLV